VAVGGSGRRGVQSVTGRVSGGGARVEGADAFYRLSKRLKEVGGTGKGSLRNEMNTALKKVVKPVVPKVKEAARAKLPKAGGLNERVAKRTPKVVTATGVKTAGIRIQDKTTDPRINQGRIFHPVFGRRPGVVQRFPRAGGYFDKTIERQAPAVRNDVVEVLADFAQRITRPL
jgi:hypothetical protein